MEDVRPPKRLFYGDVATGAHSNALKSSSSTNTPNPAPAANTKTTTIFVTDDHTATAPPSSTIDIIRAAPSPLSTTTTTSADTTNPRTTPNGGTASDVASSTSAAIKTPTSRNVDSVPSCAHYDRTITSHIGVVGDLRIYRTETGEPVPVVPTHTLAASASTVLTAPLIH
nr:unnamed protein product [Spirometra erinaceieuropaei]